MLQKSLRAAGIRFQNPCEFWGGLGRGGGPPWRNGGPMMPAARAFCPMAKPGPWPAADCGGNPRALPDLMAAASAADPCFQPNRATPSGCRRRPWPWLCHRANARAAGIIGPPFLQGAPPPSKTTPKFTWVLEANPSGTEGFLKHFLGSPRPLKMCIMSTDRFEN